MNENGPAGIEVGPIFGQNSAYRCIAPFGLNNEL